MISKKWRQMNRRTGHEKEQILAELFPMAEKLQQLRKETKEQNEELQGAVNFLYKALFAIGNYVGEKESAECGAGDE